MKFQDINIIHIKYKFTFTVGGWQKVHPIGVKLFL
jgi:hypothetical protein